MARLNSWFWNFIAKKYARDPVADPEAYQKKLEITQQYMHSEMLVAEIGCGTGTTAITHAPHVASIHASDVSTKMLEIARAKAVAKNIQNIQFTQAKAEDALDGTAPYDMIMAHSLLHLLADREKVISNVFSALKPGGIFISSTVCIANQTLPMLLLPVANFLGVLPLVKFIKPQDLLKSIKDAGFQIEHEWQPNPDRAIFIVAKKPTN